MYMKGEISRLKADKTAHWGEFRIAPGFNASLAAEVVKEKPVRGNTILPCFFVSILEVASINCLIISISLLHYQLPTWKIQKCGIFVTTSLREWQNTFALRHISRVIKMSNSSNAASKRKKIFHRILWVFSNTRKFSNFAILPYKFLRGAIEMG